MASSPAPEGQSVRPTWLLEAGIYGLLTTDLAAAVRAQGLEARMVRYHPGASPPADIDGAESLAADACVVFHGSHPLWAQIQRHRSWRPGGWCDFEALRCSAYYPLFGEHLLNCDGRIMPGWEALDSASALFAELAKEGLLFIRPDAVVKRFPGSLVDQDDFERLLSFARYDREASVLVAPPQRTLREWRLVVDGARVVAGSQYMAAGTRDIVAELPAGVRAYGDSVLADVGAIADQVYMLDVADTPAGLTVVELNGFSCSGLYGCDLNAVVASASRAASRAWLAAAQECG